MNKMFWVAIILVSLGVCSVAIIGMISIVTSLKATAQEELDPNDFGWINSNSTIFIYYPTVYYQDADTRYRFTQIDPNQLEVRNCVCD